MEDYSLLGSGVLLWTGKRHLLCTAAHVLDDYDSEKSSKPVELTTFGQGSTVVLASKDFRSPALPNDPTRRKDRVDVAWMELTKAQVSQIGEDRFLSIADVDFTEIGSERTLYSALGYPGTRNKILGRTARSGEMIVPSPIAYSALLSPTDHYKKYRLNPTKNFLVGFSKKKTTNSKGVRIHAPNAHGLSGGGLWRYRRYSTSGASFDEPVDLKLVGIIIEWKRDPEGLIVTHASCLRDLLIEKGLM
jgi:hypothetical protein